MSNEEIVQIILAAGQSSRMGSTKPLLDFDGRTALELALEAGEGSGCSQTIVVVGHEAERVRAAHATRSHVAWVVNDDPSSEQIRSLQLGLEALGEKPSPFYIHPVDSPLATSEDYRRLLEAYAGGDGMNTVYILSHDQRRGHPILCDRSVAPKILELGPNSTARDVIERESIEYVLTPNSAVLRDMDTPQDYEELLRLYRSTVS